MPRQLELQKRLNETMGRKLVDGKAIDPKFRDFLERVDQDKFLADAFPDEDTPHPEDPNRTMLTDLNKMIG